MNNKKPNSCLLNKFLIFFLFTLDITLSQENFSIKIFDRVTQKHIPFATLCNLDGKECCFADSSGTINNCKIINLKKSYLIFASGYHVDTIQFNELSGPVILYLNPIEHHLKTIEISEKVYTSLDHPFSTISARKTRITENIPEYLSTIPNVSQFDIGYRPGKLIIYGNSHYDISTFISNSLIDFFQWGTDHSIGIPYLGYSTLFVFPGSYGQTVGGNAAGGLLIAEPQIDTSGKNIFLSLNSSPIPHKSIGLNLDINKKWNLLGLKTFANFEDWRNIKNPEGEIIPGGTFYRYSLGGLVSKQFKNSVINLLFLGEDITASMLETHNHTDSNEFKEKQPFLHVHLPLQMDKNKLIEISTKHGDTSFSIKIFLSYLNSQRKESEEPSIYATDLLQHIYQIGTSIKYKRIEIPFRFWHTSFTSNGEELYIPNYGENNFHGAIRSFIPIKANKIISSVSIFSGFKEIRFSSPDSFPKRSFFSGGGNLSLSYYIKPNIQFTLSGGVGYRFPSGYELSAQGIHHGEMLFVKGNINLKPSLFTDLHLGTHIDFENIHIMPVLFFYHIKDAIILELLPSDSESNDEEFKSAIYKNADSKILAGGGLHIDWHPMERFHLETNLDLIKGRILQNKTWHNASFIPQSSIQAHQYYYFFISKTVDCAISITEKLFLPMKDLADAEKTFWPSNEVPYYLLSDAFLQIILKKEKLYHFIVDVGIRNLFNTKYLGHPTLYERVGIYAPGRSLFIKASIEF